MSLAEKTFRQGEIIIKEGDIGNSFFQILNGKAGVYANYGKGDPLRIAVLEKGEYFGEMAIIEEYPRSATVVAIGNVTVLEIPENDLNSFFAEYPDQIVELMKHLGSRVESMTKDYNDSVALLKELREDDEKKKKSLFTKIKKHIDAYQNNKNKISDPGEDPLSQAFADFKDDESGKTETFTKGKIFYREGEPGTGLYILKSGTVGIYNNYHEKNEVKTAELNAIALFGEMGLMVGESRLATAVAESDETKVEVIHNEDLESLFQANPIKVAIILRHLSYSLRKVTIDFLNTCKEITETYNS